MMRAICDKRSDGGSCCMHCVSASVGPGMNNTTEACCFCGRQQTSAWTTTYTVIPRHGAALVHFGVMPSDPWRLP